MEYIEYLIQGIVQGLTEFLPVSSSGHLNILQHLFGYTESNLFLNVMLHLGTLVSVCVFYHKLIIRLFKAFVSDNSNITKERYNELVLNTGELVMDIGTILEGQEAVDEGLIDRVGSLSDALEALYEMVENQ